MENVSEHEWDGIVWYGAQGRASYLHLQQHLLNCFCFQISRTWIRERFGVRQIPSQNCTITSPRLSLLQPVTGVVCV